jgi:hypothetical protein
MNIPVNDLDDLGVDLATKFKHTQWVTLRQLVRAIMEELNNGTPETSASCEECGESGQLHSE